MAPLYRLDSSVNDGHYSFEYNDSLGGLITAPQDSGVSETAAERAQPAAMYSCYNDSVDHLYCGFRNEFLIFGILVFC
jgi:hypothetical protein